MLSFLKKNEFNVNDIDDVINDINLIDVREEHEHKADSIKGSINIPMNKLMDNPSEYLSMDKEYHIICLGAVRSAKVVDVLKKAGYMAVNVGGGMRAYTGKYRA